MKVTALINDELVNSVVKLSHSKNITEGLVVALEDYVYRKKLEQIIDEVNNEPLQFKEDYTAVKVRELNRSKKA
jgi:hypothetical protein